MEKMCLWRNKGERWGSIVCGRCTRSAGKGSLGGLKPRARCAGFSVAEIGNRKERLRDYASFPDDFDLSPPKSPKNPITPLKTSRDTLHLETGATTLTIALRGTSGGWGYDGERKTVNKKM